MERYPLKPEIHDAEGHHMQGYTKVEEPNVVWPSFNNEIPPSAEELLSAINGFEEGLEERGKIIEKYLHKIKEDSITAAEKQIIHYVVEEIIGYLKRINEGLENVKAHVNKYKVIEDRFGTFLKELKDTTEVLSYVLEKVKEE